MSEHSVVAVFENVAKAQEAARSLEQNGVEPHQVNVVSRELESKQELHGYISGTDQDTTGAIQGAAIGGAIGLAVGIAITGLCLLTPFGQQFGFSILGPGTAMIVVAGSIFGALIGGMTGRGEKEGRIEPYDVLVKSGKALVVAHGSHDEMTRAQAILEKAGAIDTKVHHRVTAPADTTEAV